MMLRVGAFLAVLFASAGALAQGAVQQSGTVTRGNLAIWERDHIVKDGGPVPGSAACGEHVRDAVLCYSVDNTGTADTAVKFQTAINSPDATHSIFFPCGRYRLDSIVNVIASNTKVGVAEGCVNIINNNSSDTTANTFNVTGSRVDISGFNYDNTAARTGGSYVNITGREVRLLNSVFTNPFTAVTLDGDVIFFDQFTIINPVATGKAIVLKNNRAAQYVSATLGVINHDGDHDDYDYGIWADSFQDLTLGPIQIIHAKTAGGFYPGNGQTMVALKMTNSFVDTSSVRGFDFCPSGTGKIRESTITNVWSASFFQNNAMRLCPGVEGMDIIAPQLFGSIGSNIQVDGGKHWNVIGGQNAGSGTGFGIAVAAGVSDWSVILPTIGLIGQFPINFSGGIGVAGGASDRYTINVRCTAEQTACVTDGGTGIHKQVNGSIGQAGEQIFSGAGGYGWFNSAGVRAASLTDGGIMRANAFFCGPNSSPTSNASCAFGFANLSTDGASITTFGADTVNPGAIDITTPGTGGIAKGRISSEGCLSWGTTFVDCGKDNALIQGSASIGGHTVGTLPTCIAGLKGFTATANDLTAPTYGGTLTGGGSAVRTVTCDGTNWRS